MTASSSTGLSGPVSSFAAVQWLAQSSLLTSATLPALLSYLLMRSSSRIRFLFLSMSAQRLYFPQPETSGKRASLYKASGSGTAGYISAGMPPIYGPRSLGCPGSFLTARYLLWSSRSCEAETSRYGRGTLREASAIVSRRQVRFCVEELGDVCTETP